MVANPMPRATAPKGLLARLVDRILELGPVRWLIPILDAYEGGGRRRYCVRFVPLARLRVSHLEAPDEPRWENVLVPQCEGVHTVVDGPANGVEPNEFDASSVDGRRPKTNALVKRDLCLPTN